KELINSIPEDRVQQRPIYLSIDEKESSVEKILGVQWDTVADSFGYKIKIEDIASNILNNKKPTKREVLCAVMRTYDPLGLISYITIHGRILMQAIHVATNDWDSEISDALNKQWKEWIAMIKGAKDLQIPRSLVINNQGPMELHTFVDASDQAFAACVYIRSCFKGCYVVSLIAGKARVAPIKSLSIPRLELQAALLGTRLTETVRNELRLKIDKVTFWSDSQTVLAWINSPHRKYHSFVAHRISEILEVSSANQWRWVPSKENPADIATKPMNDSRLWFNGPDFLVEKENTWPKKEKIAETDEEKRFVTLHQLGEFLPEYNYSSWSKLLKHTVYLKKFVDFLKNRDEFSKTIESCDVDTARRSLLRKAQLDEFYNEYLALKEGREISKQSSLKKLMPFLDEYGLMRSRSRLENITAIPESFECAPPETSETHPIDRKQWKLVQHNSKIYWDRWKKEYLPTLIRRNKWTSKIEPLKEGDIVIITDDNGIPGKWLKGRIVKVYLAKDHQVRFVDL
uniref:DUF5641 domain-containing protein n=1 Tax=Anopheles epiroticus TaxID=199890 RepID=A0A182NZW6_9DIPT